MHRFSTKNPQPCGPMGQEESTLEITDSLDLSKKFDLQKTDPNYFLADVPSCLDQFKYRFDSEKDPFYVNSSLWNRTITAVIVTNCICIGLEVEANVSPAFNAYDFEFYDSPYFWFNSAFAVVFMIELLVKFYHEKWLYFRSNWNVMDFVLVLISVVDLVVSTFFEESERGDSILKNLTLLRILRIVRLMNEMTESWKALQVLVRALAAIVPTLIWANFVLVCFIYFWAVISTNLTKDYEGSFAALESMFGGVTKSMFSWFQVITLDHWNTSMSHFFREEVWVMRPIFIIVIIIANFGLLNCVIGSVVEEVAHVTEKLREIERLLSNVNERRLLREVFAEARKGHALRRLGAHTWMEDGLSEAEFNEVLDAPLAVEKLAALGLSRLEVSSVFNIIDVDGSGVVSEDEFVDGLMKTKAPLRSKDVHMTHAMLAGLHSRATKLFTRAKVMNDMLMNVLDTIDMVADAFDNRATVKAEAIRRLYNIVHNSFTNMYKDRTRKREELFLKMQDANVKHQKQADLEQKVECLKNVEGIPEEYRRNSLRMPKAPSVHSRASSVNGSQVGSRSGSVSPQFRRQDSGASSGGAGSNSLSAIRGSPHHKKQPMPMGSDNPAPIDEISDISLDSDIPNFMLPGGMVPDFQNFNGGYNDSLPGPV